MKDSDWNFLRQLYLTPNITKVANTLFISQPALSKRLQAIEDEMNMRIVYRNKSGLEFTPEGEYLARQSIKYFEFLDETRRQIDMIRSNHKTSISIGASLSYLKYKLPELLSAYNKLCPDVRFDITGGRSREVLAMVGEGAVDFGILRGVCPESVEKIRLNTEAGYIITSTPVALESLSRMPRIDFPLNDFCRALVDDWWKERFRTPPIIGMTVEHMDQTWPMVEQGLGYSVCFLPDVTHLPALKSLVVTPLVRADGTPVVRPTWFVYLARRSLTPQQQDFAMFIREEAEKNGK